MEEIQQSDDIEKVYRDLQAVAETGKVENPYRYLRIKRGGRLMAYNLKEVVANKKSRFTAGHRMCAGCGAPVVGRMVLRALKE